MIAFLLVIITCYLKASIGHAEYSKSNNEYYNQQSEDNPKAIKFNEDL